MPSYYTTIILPDGVNAHGWAMYARDGEEAREKALALSRSMKRDKYLIVTRQVPANSILFSGFQDPSKW